MQRALGDLGARVIKVERPDGGDFARVYNDTVYGVSAHFVGLNRNKESIAVDLASAEGRAVLDGLIARADVFIKTSPAGPSQHPCVRRESASSAGALHRRRADLDESGRESEPSVARLRRAPEALAARAPGEPERELPRRVGPVRRSAPPLAVGG